MVGIVRRDLCTRSKGAQEHKGTDAMNTTTKLPPRSRCLTPTQAEEVYGIRRNALKRAWQERRLPVYKLGHRSILIDARDIEAFLARCRVDALRA